MLIFGMQPMFNINKTFMEEKDKTFLRSSYRIQIKGISSYNKGKNLISGCESVVNLFMEEKD